MTTKNKHPLPPTPTTPTPQRAETVQIDAALWQSMRFLIEGLAIMQVFKADKPELHSEVVRLAQLIEKEIFANGN
jgi:hypothetical protein